MSFLSPLFLLGALAAAVPILLHMLKREPEARVRFAAVRLLRRAPVEHARHRRIRELLLLALRISAVVLLALAFARPFLTAAQEPSPAVTVVALDTSLSMSAPGQFERARQLARQAVERTPARDLVGIVTFADTARVAAMPAADRSLARAAIDGASAGFGGTRYRAAVAAASDMIDEHGHGRGSMVFVTDLQESGWDADDRASIPAGARVEVLDVGATPANLAVTGFRRTHGSLTALVRNSGSAPREARVKLIVDGRAAGEAAASVGGGQSIELPLPSVRGTAAHVTVEDDEGIRGDNARFLRLDNGGRPTVAIVTASGNLSREAFYVRQALAVSAPDGQAYEVEGVRAAGLSMYDPARWSRHAAVILLSTRELDEKGRERLAGYLRAGGGVLIAAGEEVDAEVVADTLGRQTPITLVPPAPAGSAPEPRRLAPADPRHPIFRVFGSKAAALGFVRFDRAVEIRSSACAPLARFTTGEIAFTECTIGEGRALVLASDLDHKWNDFPLRASFVPFVQESVRYLAGWQVATSEYVIGEGAAAEVQEPGFVELRSDAPGRPDGSAESTTVAVNVNPAESDPSRITLADFEKTVIRLKEASALEATQQPEQERQTMWRYLLLLTLLALAAESLVARRTV
jgi:hypothetical protein